nr:hypothetical protein CFP56_28720 [Quercus suber]
MDYLLEMEAITSELRTVGERSLTDCIRMKAAWTPFLAVRDDCEYGRYLGRLCREIDCAMDRMVTNSRHDHCRILADRVSEDVVETKEKLENEVKNQRLNRRADLEEQVRLQGGAIVWETHQT